MSMLLTSYLPKPVNHNFTVDIWDNLQNKVSTSLNIICMNKHIDTIKKGLDGSS